MNNKCIIKEISLDDVNEFLQKDPKLCYMGLSDSSMDYLYHKGTTLVDKNALLYGVYIDNEFVAYVQVDWWSSICANIHMYLASKLHHTGTIRVVVDKMKQYLKDNTEYRKVIIEVPAPCEHVIIAVEAFGMKLEGIITKCIIWREQVVDLKIYSLDL